LTLFIDLLQPLVYYRLNGVVLVYTPSLIIPLHCIRVMECCIKPGGYNPPGIWINP